MEHSDKAGKLILLLIYCCISALVLFRAAVVPMHYVSPDSISYLRAADFFQHKPAEEIAPPTEEETNTLKQLIAVWPAGYATCIALAAKLLNASSLLASKVVNLLFLGLIFILLYKWLGKYAWFTGLYFFSYGKLEVFSYTWSEGAFLFFIILLSYLLHQDYIHQKRDPYLFLKIFLCLSCLFLFRYAGITFFFFVAIFLVYYIVKKQFYKAWHYFLALFLSSAVVILYFLKNYLHTGLYTGTVRNYPERESYGYFFQLLYQGMANEFFLARNYFFSGYTDYLFLGLLLLQVLLIVVLFRYRKLITTPFFDSKSLFLIYTGLFYLLITIILRKISPFDKFDYRILAPFSTPFFIALFYGLTKQVAFFQKTYKWLVLFMALSFLINLPKNYILEQFKLIKATTSQLKIPLHESDRSELLENKSLVILRIFTPV